MNRLRVTVVKRAGWLRLRGSRQERSRRSRAQRWQTKDKARVIMAGLRKCLRRVHAVISQPRVRSNGLRSYGSLRSTVATSWVPGYPETEDRRPKTEPGQFVAKQ